MRSIMAAVLAAVLSACQGQPPNTTSTPTQAPAQTADGAAATPTQAAVASPDTCASVDAANLEAVLPDAVGGLALEKLSYRGDAPPDSALTFNEQTLNTIGTVAGVPLSDVSIAGAYAVDGPDAVLLGMEAIHAAGADVEAVASAVAGQPLQEETLGGKEVLTPRPGFYFYVSCNILFRVTGSPDRAADALALLP